MTRPIVVGVDPLRHDPEAPVLAGLLARATGAPVLAVAVHPHETGGDIATATRGAALARLMAVEAALHGVALETVAVAGDSASHVLHDLARERSAGLLVAGSAHRDPSDRVSVGTTADRLLHRAPCPIAVAPLGFAERMRGIRRVGVAFVDTDEGHDALRAAAVLAAACHAELHAATAVPPDAQAQLDNLRMRAGSALRDALDGLPPVARSRAQVLTGTPIAALERFSREVDLLVCGSRGYSGLSSVLHGAVSRRLIHRAACPVIVVPRRTGTRLEELIEATTLAEASHA